MDMAEFCRRAKLDREVIALWIESGWLLPRADAETARFSDIDITRAALIRDLKEAMDVNDAGVSVALDLIDQVHGLRRLLRQVVNAMGAEHEDTRARIAVAVCTGRCGEETN